MINVLQSQREVEEATSFLTEQGLPTHATIEKNWDQFLLYYLLNAHPRDARILDLGCGDCCTLDFLAGLGFANLHGIDLQIKQPSENYSYQLHQGDLMATPFPDQFCDVAVSISVIEHGVKLESFFKEANRLLNPGGLLFVTTDYWQTDIPIEETIKPFGLAWKIFSQADIEATIALANQHHFVLEHPIPIPACVDRTVSWYNKHYTFIALAFRKQIL